MTMPAPPPDTRAPGQSGHIADHNTISDALTALEAAVLALQSSIVQLTPGGSVDVSTIGQGIQVAEGSNAKQGTVTLNGTVAVVVANSSVTATSRIFLTVQAPGGVTPGAPYVSARTAGTSFSVKSTIASDNSVVAFEIFEAG